MTGLTNWTFYTRNTAAVRRVTRGWRVNNFTPARHTHTHITIVEPNNTSMHVSIASRALYVDQLIIHDEAASSGTGATAAWLPVYSVQTDLSQITVSTHNDACTTTWPLMMHSDCARVAITIATIRYDRR